MQANLYSGLALAYMGDSVYELYVRDYLLKFDTKVNILHKKAILYTSAKAQSSVVRVLINEGFLSEEEMVYYKRGRNSHVNLTRKNIELADYLDATGFEALIGYLYLVNNNSRIIEIMEKVFQII